MSLPYFSSIRTSSGTLTSKPFFFPLQPEVSEMSDLNKPFREDMLLKPSEELFMAEPHLLGFRSVSVVLVAEPDVGTIHFKL